MKTNFQKKKDLARYKFNSMVAKKRPPRGYVPSLVEKSLQAIGQKPEL